MVHSDLVPYGLFLGYFDHSPAIRLGTDSRFSAKRIEAIRNAFSERCCRLAASRNTPDLYKPTFATSFGHTDDIAFSFIDDFAAISHLASCSPQLESYTVAHSFAPATFESNPGARLLATPEEILKKQSSRPLLAVTHVKLHGFLTLGFGLNAQTSAASLVLSRMSETLSLLQDTVLREEHEELFEMKPVTDVRISILDPVASEDLLILTACSNYSVAASLLAATRQITLEDLWTHAKNQNDSLQSVVENNRPLSPAKFTAKEFLDQVSKLGEPQRKAGEPGDTNATSPTVGCDQLIASTYTTLSVLGSIPSLMSLAYKVCCYVSSTTLADINPGRETELANRLKDRPRKVSEYEHVSFGKEFNFVLPGKHDLSVNVANELGGTGGLCIKTSDFFLFTADLFSDSHQACDDSGFQDINSHLAIPVLKIGSARERDTGYRLLKHYLDPPPPQQACQRFRTMFVLEEVSSLMLAKLGLDDTEALDDNLKQLRVGPSARSSIIRLFSEFAKALGDPLLFDSVLDLSDCYLAMHRIICQAPKRLLNLGPADRMASFAHCREMITDVSESLWRAFLLRVGRSSAKTEERNGDACGSITNLLSAGDTALKSSLGLLKKTVYSSEFTLFEARERITGVISAQVNQKATVNNKRLADTLISVVNIDTAHVFRPDHLSRVLHEVGHLFFETQIASASDAFFGQMEDCDEKLLPKKASRHDVYMRCAELFADGFIQAFIFGHHCDSFIKQQICTFDCTISETLPPHEEEILEFLVTSAAELLYRSFLIESAVENGLLSKTGYHAQHETLEEYTRRCNSFANKWCGTICTVGELGEEAASVVCSLCELWAQENYDRRLVYDRLWMKLNEAYVTLRGEMHDGASHHDSILCNQVEAAVAKQIPFSLESLSGEPHESVVVFHLIYLYIKETFGRYDSNKYDRLTNSFQMSVSQRQQEFTLLTTIMKSLWHISTRQRARRMFSLMEELKNAPL